MVVLAVFGLATIMIAYWWHVYVVSQKNEQIRKLTDRNEKIDKLDKVAFEYTAKPKNQAKIHIKGFYHKAFSVAMKEWFAGEEDELHFTELETTVNDGPPDKLHYGIMFRRDGKNMFSILHIYIKKSGHAIVPFIETLESMNRVDTALKGFMIENDDLHSFITQKKKSR